MVPRFLTALFLTTIFSGSLANADGFICEAYAGNLKIAVLNHGDVAVGAHNPAVMIVSDPNLDADRTIAIFNSENSLLTHTSATYNGKVDLNLGTIPSDEKILGVNLSEIEQIILHVTYSFTSNLTDDSEVPGDMIVTMRSGAPDIHLEALCYVKN